MDTSALTEIRELDSRLSNGLQVRLLWNARTDRLFVVVLDTRTGGVLRLTVADDEQPADVFNHPFAYAAHHHVEATPTGVRFSLGVPA